jgi:predicted Zn-dependent peptidase
MITTTTLACGMPLICEVIPGVRSVGLTWMLPAGVATDPPDRQGLSTLMSELIFRGAGDLDSRRQADALDRLGVARSCSTGHLFLRLSATMIGANLPDALPLLVDMVRRPRVDPESLEPARDLALQSLAALADNPPERAGIILNQRHAALPCDRSTLGTPEGLGAASRDDLLAHWARRVRPASCILGIAGDLDPAVVARRLDELLAGWQGVADPVTFSPNPARGSSHHEPDASAQVHIYLAHEAPPEPHPDARFERVLAAILSGGTSSRLFTEVRERRGLCYAVSSSYAPDRFFGRVVAYVGTTPERAQQSLDVLVGELLRINQARGPDAVTEEEFDRAMVGLTTRLVFSGESSQARASALASDQWRLGRARSLEQMRQEVASITRADLLAYLGRRQLGPTTIVTLGPSPLHRPPGI